VFSSVGSFRFEPRLSAENRHKVGLRGKSVAKISGVPNDPMGRLARAGITRLANRRRGKVHFMVGHLNIPDETLLALKLSADAAEREVVLVAAVKLYEMGRLSAGAASQLAGLPKPVFMTKLADYGVPIFKLSDEEIARDAQNA
jgi:predicted HTH domain antitoxin